MVECSFSDRTQKYKSLKSELQEIAKKQPEYLLQFKSNLTSPSGFSRPKYYVDNNTVSKSYYEGLLSTCFVSLSLRSLIFPLEPQFEHIWDEKQKKACRKLIFNRTWAYFTKTNPIYYEDDTKFMRLPLENIRIKKDGDLHPFQLTDINLSDELYYEPPIFKYDIYSAPIILMALDDLDTDYETLNPDDQDKIKSAIIAILVRISSGAAQFNRHYPQSGFLTFCAINALLRWIAVTCSITNSELEEYIKNDLNSDEKIELKLNDDDQPFQVILSRVKNWMNAQLLEQIAFYAENDYDKIDPIRCIFSISTLNLIHEQRELFEFLFDDPIVESINEKITKKLIEKIFHDQEESGLWKKYKPVATLPADGSLYPFALYSLKNLVTISEPTTSIFTEFARNIENAINWIKNNERKGVKITNNEEYAEAPDFKIRKVSGWRSNHRLNPSGNPEAWSTALVFESVNGMLKKLNKDMTKDIVQTYGGTYSFTDNQQDDLKSKLDNAAHFHTINGKDGKSTLAEELRLRLTPNNNEVKTNSVIFYGPPGTGKSTLAKAIASEINWSYLVVDTGLIFMDGTEKVISKINEIFDNLDHLENTVILFDEIDEFIKNRTLDTATFENRVLTNTMLTKLQNLADNKKIIYFVNTNNVDEVDEAIKRPGRFDFQIHVGHNRSLIKEKIKDKTSDEFAEKFEKICGSIFNLNHDTLCSLTIEQWIEFTEYCLKDENKIDIPNIQNVETFLKPPTT